ncbi:hypothetical protein [Bacillus sp. 491mf]|uniref:hypothetical protein n=1 Tax=Bacillus sp. 491mf TaxID=1761755 RepID=UPI001C431313|nr:hypothetical protein [Bacillus sp. 491mf]
MHLRRYIVKSADILQRMLANGKEADNVNNATIVSRFNNLFMPFPLPYSLYIQKLTK